LVLPVSVSSKGTFFSSNVDILMIKFTKKVKQNIAINTTGQDPLINLATFFADPESFGSSLFQTNDLTEEGQFA
jgi:hypothetical protein